MRNDGPAAQVPDPTRARVSTRATLSTVLPEALATLLLLLDMLLGYAAGVASASNRSEAAGAVVATPVLLGVVLGSFHLFGKAKTRRSRAMTACWTLAIIGLAQGETYSRTRHHGGLTNADRAGLRIDGSMIRHERLGFVLPSPGKGFAFDAKMQGSLTQALAGHPNMAAWALADSGESRAVFVEAITGVNDRESFTRFVKGMRGTVGAASTTVLQDSLAWSDASHEFRLSLVTKAGVYSKTRCLPSADPAPTAVAVCVMTFTHDLTSLDFVRDGLRFTSGS
jgi:hypothetical protein